MPDIPNRKERANTHRSIGRFIDKLLARVPRDGHTVTIIIRADSEFQNHELFQDLRRREIAFSVAAMLSKTLRAQIAHIPETPWVTVADYPVGGQAPVAATERKAFRLIVGCTRLIGG